MDRDKGWFGLGLIGRGLIGKGRLMGEREGERGRGVSVSIQKSVEVDGVLLFLSCGAHISYTAAPAASTVAWPSINYMYPI